MSDNTDERPPSGWRSFVFRMLGQGSIAGAVVTTLQIADGLFLFSDVFKIVIEYADVIALTVWTALALAFWRLPEVTQLDALFLTFGFFMLCQFVSVSTWPGREISRATFASWVSLFLGFSVFAAIYAGSDLLLYEMQFSRTGQYGGIQKILYEVYNQWLNPSPWLILRLPPEIAKFLSVYLFYISCLASGFVIFGILATLLSISMDISLLSKRVWLIIRLCAVLLMINFGLLWYAQQS